MQIPTLMLSCQNLVSDTFTITFPPILIMQLSTTRFNSTCADIFVDALRGTATVMFKDSLKVYRYFNISRRACFNFVNNPNMSTGFWLNANVLDNPRVECFA